MRKFFRTTYAVAVSVLFLLVAVLGFTQTKVFRSYLRSLLIENVAAATHAELTLGSLEGNLFTGFHADSVLLKRDGDSLLTVKRVEASYDPLGVLTHTIPVTRVTLVEPVFHLSRSRTGTWNVAQLLRSSSTDTTPSPWTVHLKQIQIQRGELHLADSLDLSLRQADTTMQIWPGRIDYANLQLDSLMLDAGLTLRPHDVQLVLRSLSCRLSKPDVRIRELAGDFRLTPGSTSVQNLLLRTARSSVALDAKLDSIDITKITDLAQLRTAPVSLRLKLEPLSFAELKQFIGRPVSFLENDVAAQFDAVGRFGSLDLRNLTLHSGATTVRIAGTVSNLHQPENLELDLACVRNNVTSDDLRRLMPSLKIPDLSRLGQVDYDLRFRGRPLAFDVRLNAGSHTGSVEVNGTMDLRESPFSYDGTIKTMGLNLAPIVGDSSLTSRIQSTVTVQGRGFSLPTLTCVARAEIDSSEFYGLPMSRSVLVVDVAERTIRPRLSARLGSARIDLGGAIAANQQELSSYDFSGRINSLNLADVTKRPDQASDLSFDLQAKGMYRTAEALKGDLNLNFFRSSFDTAHFAGGPATFHINTLEGAAHTMTLASEIADVNVQGAFTPSTVATALVKALTLVGEGISYRINTLDVVRGGTPDQPPPKPFRSTVASSRDSVGYTFTLSLKDCYPIGVFLGRVMGGSLDISGQVQQRSDVLSLGASATVHDVLYDDRVVSFGMSDGKVELRADGLSAAELLPSMKISLSASARRFDIQNFRTAGLTADIAMAGDSSSFAVEGLLDSVATVRLRGSAVNADRLIRINLDRLEADFNTLLYQNSGPVILAVGRDGLQVSTLQMHHDKEEVGLAGVFNPAGSSNLAVSIHNVAVGSIPHVVRRTASIDALPAMSGMVDANATFDGTFESPGFSLDMHATDVHIDQETFGTVQLRSSYADHVLNIFGQLQSRNDSGAVPELLVNGTVPYDLSMSGRGEQKLEGEMNLDVQSTNFRLEFLDPFIPELSELSGKVICNMKMRGTVESPAYEGSVILEQAKFFFNPLGIRYLVDGKLVPSGRQIAFQDVSVRNVASDRPDGKMNLSGSFSLEGLRIRDFDLVANGQLLVMKESARRANQGLYGDLFAGTGPLGISWKGSPSRSYVSGEVAVKNASLTLPPVKQAQDLPNARIDVRVINDTIPDSVAVALREKLAAAAKSAGPRVVRQQASAQSDAAAQTKSFLDNIVYNLSIETQGVTQLRFVFSNFTNENLLAELKGRTAFTRDGDQMHLTGELDLGSRSYYNNFKKLDAAGKVRFTGDPLNPELDITATYEGVHRGVDSTAGARLGGSSEKVVVKVLITGTRVQPKVKMGLSEFDQLGNVVHRDRPDVEGDAIAFLVTGSFRDELTQQDKLSLAGSNVIGGVASSILSGPLTDLLRKEFGIVRSVDVLYYGGGGSIQESADVRLTGEVGDAVIRLGGRVLSDLNNTNISIQLPMSAIVGSEKWRNLLLEAERTVQGVETVDQRRESRGVRLLYRIIF